MKCCVSTDVGTWKNWLTFEPDPDHSPDAEIGFLSPTATRQSGVLLRREHRRRKERKSGRACEALRVEAGWSFRERDRASIPPEAKEHCKFFHGGLRGRAPAKIDFCTIFGLQMSTGGHDLHFENLYSPHNSDSSSDKINTILYNNNTKNKLN